MIVTDNTGEPSHAGVLSSTWWAGQSFTTDATTYELSRISIQGTAGNNVTLSLYDNNAGVPGSLIHTLAGPTSFTWPEDLRVYTPTTPVLLNALTTYFVVAKATGGFIDWRLTPSTSETGPGSIGNVPFFSVDSGASWTASGAGLPVKFRVEGVVTAVPEASSVLFLGLAGVALLGASRVKIARQPSAIAPSSAA
ncbi:MAG: hypothetical protein KF847_20295 [Pirellulales bacterium]|nr:hypothetical protein [Pirellulales bacterium]